jgi:hypothetical protein
MSAISQGKAATVNSRPARQEWQARKVEDWLLAILRFAITLDDADRALVLALADDMDRLGARTARPAFGFFERASIDVCHAVTAREDPRALRVLRRHLARIEEPRLKRAFKAACLIPPSAAFISRAAIQPSR